MYTKEIIWIQLYLLIYYLPQKTRRENESEIDFLDKSIGYFSFFILVSQ